MQLILGWDRAGSQVAQSQVLQISDQLICCSRGMIVGKGIDRTFYPLNSIVGFIFTCA